MQRVATICVGCLAILTLAGDVFAREWTDRQGRNASGDFVRVFQGNVVLRRGKQVVQVPFAQFSPEDQEYVRKELEKKNQSYLLEGVPTEPVTPETVENPDGDPAANPTTPENGNPGGKLPSFPGMNGGVVPPPIGPGAPTIPTVPPVINSPLFPGAGNPAAGTPSNPADPAMDPAAIDPAMDPAAIDPVPSPISNHGAAGHRPGSSWPSHTPTPSPTIPTFEPPKSTSYTPPSSYTPPPMPSYTPPPMPNIPGAPSGSQQYSKYCASCKTPVPDHITAGDKCPGCGVTFDSDETNGKTAFTPRRIAWLVSVAVGVLLFIGRALNR